MEIAQIVATLPRQLHYSNKFIKQNKKAKKTGAVQALYTPTLFETNVSISPLPPSEMLALSTSLSLSLSLFFKHNPLVSKYPRSVACCPEGIFLISYFLFSQHLCVHSVRVVLYHIV